MDQQNNNNQNRNPLRADEPIIVGESEKMKKLFKALAVLVVFLSTFSVPFYLALKAQDKATEMRAKMEMNQIRNWAMVYEIENKSYDGLGEDPEINKVFIDIDSMGGNTSIFVSNNHRQYCCQTKFKNKALGSWCVDYTGFVGNDGKCSAINVRCQ